MRLTLVTGLEVTPEGLKEMLEVSSLGLLLEERLVNLQVLTPEEIWSDCDCLRCQHERYIHLNHRHTFFDWDKEYEICGTCLRLARIVDYEVGDLVSNERFESYWKCSDE